MPEEIIRRILRLDGYEIFDHLFENIPRSPDSKKQHKSATVYTSWSKAVLAYC